jgi:GxxExxY protein
MTSDASIADVQDRSEAKDRGFDALSTAILDAAFAVHRAIGTGLLQRIYELCFCHEMHLCGLEFTRKHQVPLVCCGKTLRSQTEVPLLVAGRIPVFCLSVAELTARHEATLRHRLRQGSFPFGYLLNFNAPQLSKGIRRMELPKTR